MSQNRQETSVVNIRDILFILRKRIILLLAVIFLVTCVGVLYSRTQEPRYTANELVFLKAKNDQNNNVTDNVSAMISYVETVVDFCDEGVVVDRANFHYDEYLKMKANEEISNVQEYINWSTTMYRQERDTYQGQKVEVQYIKRADIDTTLGEKTITGHRPFNFSVEYTDDFSSLAKEKVKILVHALKLESLEFDDDGQRKYFYGVEVQIVDEELQGISTNVSRSKTILMFFALGVILGLVAAFLSYYLDNTVKTKIELEYLTGVGTMSIIEYLGGEK